MQKDSQRRVFERIYQAFSSGIFRFIYFKVSDVELAKDLTAETFIRFWKTLLKNKTIVNEKAFLYFVAKGLVVDYYRSKKHKNTISLTTVDERLLGTIDTVENTLIQKQQVDEIYVKLQTIKQEYQDILLLHYIEDLRIKEIAYILKKKEGTIRVLLHRALQALKGKL